jgi:hypothetical protein
MEGIDRIVDDTIMLPPEADLTCRAQIPRER